MPNFKSKNKNQNSFSTNNQDCTIEIIEDEFIKIPKLKQPIKFVNHRQLPENSVIKGATVSKDCRNHYYISVLVEYYIEEKQIPSNNIVGLDYSQHDFYVSSDHEKANYPHYYSESEDKLKLEDRGKQFIKIDKWYPSSKICSGCKNKKHNLLLSDKVYKCEFMLNINGYFHCCLFNNI